MASAILDIFIRILIATLGVIESIGFNFLLKANSILLIVIALYNLFKILIKYRFRYFKDALIGNKYIFTYLGANYILITFYILVIKYTDVYNFLLEYFNSHYLSEFMHAIFIFLCLFIILDQLKNLSDVLLKPIELLIVDWDKRVALKNMKANSFEIIFEILFTLFLIICLKLFSTPLIIMILAFGVRIFNYYLKNKWNIESINVKEELDLFIDEWYNKFEK